jgi:hypothetical protein
MPRGVATVAETRQEAERQVLADAPHMRVLRCREIDLTGLPPLRTGPIPRHWVVVVEHLDPNEEAKLPQHDNPEAHCEREVRLAFLKLATDPKLLVTGEIEQFACPACGEPIRLEMPPAGQRRARTGTACPSCRAPLKRASESDPWAVAPRKPTTARRCVFCDAKADSYEHVIPEWISKRLGVRDFLSADGAFVAAGAERPTRPISFASYRSRIFCAACNTHFKHLEDAVIPLLVPIARGFTLRLDSDTQALLALWAHKTAIALVAATPIESDAVPEPHRRAVRDRGSAGTDTWVAFFAWHGSPVLGTAKMQLVDRALPHAPRSGYLAFLTFAQLGFAVIGVTEPLRAHETIDAELPPLARFWPQRAQLQPWPPRPVDNRVLPALLSFVPIRANPSHHRQARGQ